MGEMLIIDPKWRGGKPFAVYRNPGSRDRRDIFNDEWRSARFVLTGSGDLIVGRAYEFLHGDSHTRLTSIYGANFVWSGELILDGPKFPTAFGLTLNPKIAYEDAARFTSGRHRDPFDQSCDAEFNDEGTVCLARMSHYSYRDRGFLDQSRRWRNFTRGLKLGLPAIEPLPGFTVNQKVEAKTRALILLHNDGHLYFFDHGEDIHEACHKLSIAEWNLFARGKRGGGGDPLVGVAVGGNGNMHVRFSEGSCPIALFKDNQNVHECFGEDFDFETTFSDIAIARFNTRDAIPRDQLPDWEDTSDE